MKRINQPIFKNNFLLQLIGIIKGFYAINTNTPNCINFDEIGSTITEYFIKDFEPIVISDGLRGSVDEFIGQYKYLMKSRFKNKNKVEFIVKSGILKPSFTPTKKSEFKKYIEAYLNNTIFYELRNIVANLKPNYNENKLTLYHPDQVENALNTAVGKINVGGITTEIMKFNNKLIKLQCDMEKKCCG